MLAGRDYKGLGFLLLLPVVAVALVMLILTVNIDPTSPTLTARLEPMLDNPTISVAAPPPLLAACMALERGGPGSCTGGHTFLQVTNVTDSYQLSQQLLQARLLQHAVPVLHHFALVKQPSHPEPLSC